MQIKLRLENWKIHIIFLQTLSAPVSKIEQNSLSSTKFKRVFSEFLYKRWSNAITCKCKISLQNIHLKIVQK